MMSGARPTAHHGVGLLCAGFCVYFYAQTSGGKSLAVLFH